METARITLGTKLKVRKAALYQRQAVLIPCEPQGCPECDELRQAAKLALTALALRAELRDLERRFGDIVARVGAHTGYTLPVTAHGAANGGSEALTE